MAIKKSNHNKQTDKYYKYSYVQDQIYKGFSKKVILEIIGKKFDLDSYSARNKLYKEATDYFSQFEENYEQVAIDRLESLYQMSFQAGKTKDCIEIIKAINTLKNDNNVPVDHTFNINLSD